MGMIMMKKSTRKVNVGGIVIGGGAPVTVQSMTNTDTRDISSTCDQISRLTDVGCDIIRLAIVDMEAAEAVKEIRKRCLVPLVADIHFDYRLALECIENGIDKIRINPGNIGGEERIAKVVGAAKERNIPIRIGINSGSIEKDILFEYGKPCAQAMVQSAKRHIDLLLNHNFEDIIVSLKASDVPMTIESYRLIAGMYDFPLHLGVTEAGTLHSGIIKSSVGIGTLLAEGIGDTIRVSLTGDPVDEVIAGRKILSSLNLLKENVNIISCPTCGRCRVNIIDIASELERKVSRIKKNITVAIMGCAVNGPGEACEADIGIAGGENEYLLFEKGMIVGKIPAENILDVLMDKIKNNF